VKNAITLDGQTFRDDDGSVYMYWGTWGIYKGFGCGAGKLNPDMKSFSETKLIPNTEVTHFFEAPFVFKRNGIYYFLYSCEHCEDASYRVDYATAKSPLGPYTYHGTILKTNADGTVHGPGHNSVLQEGDNYYIVYHRHDNPHSNRGFHRQVAIDKLEFNADGTIKEVVPTHEGLDLKPEMKVAKNLAFGAKVTASSYYDNDFRPEYAVDDNNGTLWRPRTTGPAWIQLDLGKKQNIKSIWTQFEYGTQFYQYLIETSNDGKHWQTFSDKRQNRLAGSPMVDFGNAKAQYIRLTYTGGQKNGFGGAIWNIKVYGSVEDSSPQQWIGLTAADFDGTTWHNNEGMLAGKFSLLQGTALRERMAGKDAITLQPGTQLVMIHPQLGKTRKHTLTAQAFDNGSWHQIDENDPRLNLSEGKLSNVLSMKSKYSPRIYELLKLNQYQKKGFSIHIDDLRKLFKAENIYPKYNDFKKNIILKAQEELELYSDIRFEFKECKMPRQVSYLNFYVFKNIPTAKKKTNKTSNAPKTKKELNTDKIITDQEKDKIKAEKVKADFDAVYKLFLTLPQEEQSQIELEAYNDFLKESESSDNKTLRGIFEKSKKPLIIKKFKEKKFKPRKKS
jgi:hypothetical protein